MRMRQRQLQLQVQLQVQLPQHHQHQQQQQYGFLHDKGNCIPFFFVACFVQPGTGFVVASKGVDQEL